MGIDFPSLRSLVKLMAHFTHHSQKNHFFFPSNLGPLPLNVAPPHLQITFTQIHQREKRHKPKTEAEKEASRIMLVTDNLLNADGGQLNGSCSRVLGPLHPVHPSAFLLQLGPQASLTGPLCHLNDLNGLLLTHVLGR